MLMSAAHFHLALNHIPLLGILFGAALLAYGVWRDEESVQKASLGLLAIAGLTTIAVYLTGEPAEDMVEGLAGVSHDALEAHEALGTYALVAGLLTAFSALLALVLRVARERLVRWTVLLTLALALASIGLIGYTANLGGKISHPELRADAPTSTGETPDENEEHE
jgi:uncharacterized protein YacL